MNKILFSFSLIIISALHYFFLYTNIQKEKKQIIKPQYSKISLQLAKIEKEILSVQKKKTIEKEKNLIKIKKKKLNKKLKKKLIKKKIKETKQIKQEKINNNIITKPQIKNNERKNILKKNVKKASNKNIAKSLEKNKKSKQTYLSDLRIAIDKNKRYPKVSERLGEEGIVTLEFMILKSGIFKNMRILISSGKKRLDKAALKALLKTKRFKPFDSSINKDFMIIKAPIEFKIEK